jgi:uncharacterized damage-inducible protein DinB
MSEVRRLAELLHQAYEGEAGTDDAWHGPSLRKLVTGLTAADASRLLPGGGHTIWELVLHIAVWDEICRRRIADEAVATTTGSPEDWPAVEGTTDHDWAATVERLRKAQAALVRAVAALSDAALEERVPGRTDSKYLVIHGTLHHDLYHAGQIGQLRRALSSARG